MFDNLLCFFFIVISTFQIYFNDIMLIEVMNSFVFLKVYFVYVLNGNN